MLYRQERSRGRRVPSQPDGAANLRDDQNEKLGRATPNGNLHSHTTSTHNNSTTMTMPPDRPDSTRTLRRRILVLSLSFPRLLLLLFLLTLLPPCGGLTYSSILVLRHNPRKVATNPSCFLFPFFPPCFSSRAAGIQSLHKRRRTGISLTAR